MATITGRNVVVDPRVKGQLNLVTERAVTPAAAFQQFLAALRLQGFTVVEAAGLYKVVPEADAKLQGGSVSVVQGNAGSAPGGGQIVTQIFKLNFENAANLVPVLRPLISPNNTINVNPGNNSLVITDYADNLQRLARIVAAMDVSNASDVEVIPLKNAIASDLAPLVSRLIDGGSANGRRSRGRAWPGRHRVQDHPDCRAAQQLADPARRQPGPRGPGARPGGPAGPGARAGQQRGQRQHPCGLPQERRRHQAGHHPARRHGSHGRQQWRCSQRRWRCQRARAQHGAEHRGMLSTNGSSSGSSTGGGLGSSTSAMGTSSTNNNQPSTGGQIQADPTTNSLIITAPSRCTASCAT